MQYKRHNFYQNFLNAGKSDIGAAWDMLTNEIAELAVDQPSKLIEALRTAKVQISDNASAKSLCVLAIDNLYKNTAFKTELVKQIAIRHKDPNVSGSRVAITGKQQNELAVIVDNIIKDETGQVPAATAKKLVLTNLASKQQARGIKPTSPLKVLAVLSLITGAIYLGHKYLK